MSKLDWPLIGNEHIKEFFQRHLKQGNIGGTYIFAGPQDAGKATVARYLAQALLCETNKNQIQPCGQCRSCLSFTAFFQPNTDQEAGKDSAQFLSSFSTLTSTHSDYIVIEQEEGKKNISIQQVRHFIQHLSHSSFLNSYKIGLIKDAHRLSLQAANALLKTLEEPKKKVVIILTVDVLEQLPQTIVSRAQVLQFLPVKTEVIYKYLLANYSLSRPQARYLAAQAAGRPALAKKFAQDKEFLNYWQKIVELFFAFLPLNFTQRTKLVSETIFKKDKFSQTTSLTLNIWQGVVRDILLAGFDQIDLGQHQSFSRQIKKWAEKLSPLVLLKWLEAIETAQKYKQANVSDKLIFEYLALRM